jgi:hypothetical protein
MVETTSTYARIVKTDKQPDGTLKVYGKATDDSLDIDKQICDNTWLKEAMPQWFTTGGNIREQHSSIAAGVATDYEEKADGHYITALVVDPTSVKKVETGVLKGFSIGIRGPQVMRSEKAPGGIITGGQIVEISLVDRPANPNAKMTIAKAAESGELMAVEQITIPSPSDVFGKSAEEVAPEVIEEVVAEEVATEEIAESANEEIETPEVAEEVAPEVEIVEAAKSLIATLNKFDQAIFDVAIGAIADLIVVEAQEMKQGSDERESIKELLRAAKHLCEWYEGEAANGEVPGVAPESMVYATEETLEMAADTKCDKCDELTMDCKCADYKSADPEEVEEIVAKAVTAAKEAVVAELEILKSAIAEKEDTNSKLKADLDSALAKAAPGGPSRTAPVITIQTSEAKARIADLRNKAAATLDRTLAEGYEAIARDLEKSLKGQNNAN